MDIFRIIGMNSFMTYLGIAYGLALVALGVFVYFKSGAVSVTTLIPAFLGTPVTVLALLSLNPKFLKIGMHNIVVIALLGFIATAKDTLGLISGKEIENQLAAYSKAITCIMSIAFIVFSIVNFIKARRANKIDPS